MFTLSIVIALLAINWTVDALDACPTIEDRLDEVQEQLASLTAKSEACRGPYASCQDLLNAHPNIRSGKYNLVVDGNDVTVYCEMGTPGVCGGEGGWTRIANVDTAAGDDCPSGLYPQTRGGIKLCDRNQGLSGCRCDGTTFDTHGISYTKVCGRVRGYQFDGSGFIDGIYNNHRGENNLNGCYVDGVSITRGSTREHIWTFGNGHLETGTGIYDCPCNSGSTATVPGYVGNNYYCESGTSSDARNTFYSGDPLWDGRNCNSREANCCTNSNLPYFVRDLAAASTDGVELRVCTSESLPDEATGIDQIELYIK